MTVGEAGFILGLINLIIIVCVIIRIESRHKDQLTFNSKTLESFTCVNKTLNTQNDILKSLNNR